MAGTEQTTGWAGFWNRGGFIKAIVLVAVYLGLYLASGQVLGLIVDRPGADERFDSPENVLLSLTLPLIVGSAILVIFGMSVGWLRQLFGRQPIRGSAWMWIAPIVVVGFNVIRFASVDYSDYAIGVVLMVLLTGLFVGFAEEVLFRGYAVNLLRRGGYNEWLVAVLSSLLFAASHGLNIFGQDLFTTVVQIAYTFFFGVCMYLTMRVTGNLLFAVLVHASTDPSLMLYSHGVGEVVEGTSGTLGTIAGLGNFAIILVGLILVIFIRGKVGRSTDNQAPEPAPA